MLSVMNARAGRLDDGGRVSAANEAAHLFRHAATEP